MKTIIMTTMDMMMCCSVMQMYNVIDVFRVCYKA